LYDYQQSRDQLIREVEDYYRTDPIYRYEDRLVQMKVDDEQAYLDLRARRNATSLQNKASVVVPATPESGVKPSESIPEVAVYTAEGNIESGKRVGQAVDSVVPAANTKRVGAAVDTYSVPLPNVLPVVPSVYLGNTVGTENCCTSQYQYWPLSGWGKRRRWRRKLRNPFGRGAIAPSVQY
jgi:hypothetical protein